MIKYDLIPEQLIYEGTITPENLFEPNPMDESVILETHDPGYLKRLKAGQLTRMEERRTGFPLTRALVDREIIIVNGTVQCALFALEYGVSLNIAGGTHHAYADRGEGFCLLNDLAIAANHLLNHGLVSRVLIADLDVHQGNGTASIFAGDRRVFTFSMHGKRNYPLHKERSDLDIELEDGTSDEIYLEVLHRNLNEAMKSFQPELVLYQSGVDVLGTDKLGRLNLTIGGCKKRDALVFSLCRENHVPVTVSMGGGYSSRLSDIITAHANTFRLAHEMFF